MVSTGKSIELRAIAGDDVTPAFGDLDGGGPFNDRESSTRQALGGIVFPLVEVDLALRFVACRLPHGDRGRERQPMQPLHQILGILTCGIQPNVKVNSRMFFRQLLQDRSRQANLPCWKCSAEYAENSGVWRDTNVPPLLVREIEKVLP